MDPTEPPPPDTGPPAEMPGDMSAGIPESPEQMERRLEQIERLLKPVLRPGKDALRVVGDAARPAWQQVTSVESRIAVTLTIVVAIVLMALLPDRVANHPRWLVPGLASVLLLVVIIVNPMKVDEKSRRLRPIVFTLLAVIAIGNVISAGRLIVGLVNTTGIKSPETLLLTGVSIWTTNMIVFAIVYWEFDRGGPAERAMASHLVPDFLFPQMASPEFACPDWEPLFVDYLYLSFTNATAFSPTDVMPLTHWTKLTMLAQSAISLVTVALVIVRAVNILG